MLVAEEVDVRPVQVTALYNPAPNPHVLEGALVQVGPTARSILPGVLKC